MEPVMQLKLVATARDDPDEVNLSGPTIAHHNHSHVFVQSRTCTLCGSSFLLIWLYVPHVLYTIRYITCFATSKSIRSLCSISKSIWYSCPTSDSIRYLHHINNHLPSRTGLAGGCCFDFNRHNEHLFIVGTEEGKIHKCSKAYSGQYLETYEGREGTMDLSSEIYLGLYRWCIMWLITPYNAAIHDTQHVTNVHTFLPIFYVRKQTMN